LESLPKIGIGEPISSIWCINEMNPLLPEALDKTTNPPNLDKALEFGNHKGATKISAPPKKLVE